MPLNCIIETEKQYLRLKKKISLDDVQDDIIRNLELTGGYRKMSLRNISVF